MPPPEPSNSPTVSPEKNNMAGTQDKYFKVVLTDMLRDLKEDTNKPLIVRTTEGNKTVQHLEVEIKSLKKIQIEEKLERKKN